MTKVCIFYDGVKESRFEASQFPVTIGGKNVDIVLPAVPPLEGVAYIDFAEEQAFIQPEERSRVFLNEKKLTESSWLSDGDSIRIGAATVSCIVNHKQIIFHLLPPVAKKNKVLKPPGRQDNRSVPPAKPKIETHSTELSATDSQQQTKHKLTPVSIVLLAVFVFLLSLTGFVFIATPVTFNIVPEPEDLDVNGGLFNMKMAEHYLVWPGKYHVRAEKKGYISLDKMVRIKRGSPVSFDFQMEKLGGILILSSEPIDGVDVFINDQLAGQTPLVNLQVTPGRHDIVFKHPRYQSFEQVIEVEGEGRKQVITVRLVPDWATIEFQSQPLAAIVKVDGRERGSTPVKLELLAGKRHVRLEKEGFESWAEEMNVTAGENQNLALITLEKSPGILLLSTRPVGVSVLADGKFEGLTPLKLKLKPAIKHEIKLFKAGYEEVIREVEIASDNEESMELQLPAKYGIINLLGVPSGATLYIDGKQQKNFTNKLSLITRAHQLEVRKAGFQPFTTKVTPRSGFPKRVKVSLKPSEQVASPAKALTANEQASLVNVKPGRFMMGASRREQGRRSNEVLHEVELTRPFHMGKKEVSNAAFKKFKPDHYSGSAQGLSLDDDQFPVVNVSWDEAARYCNWLSKQYGLAPVYIEKEAGMMASRPLSNGYRLPTEAEWVWAARYAGQGSSLKYPWGQSFPVVANSGNYAKGDNYTVSAPVATFKPSRRGLYDTGGNVSEWVNDYYSVIIESGKAPVKNPLGPVTGKHHVIRGSSWRHGSISELRLSYRDYGQNKRSDLGFRVARYAD